MNTDELRRTYLSNYQPTKCYEKAKEEYLLKQDEYTFLRMWDQASFALESYLIMYCEAKYILEDAYKYNLKYQEGKFVHIYA
jgi:hypothetical protein